MGKVSCSIDASQPLVCEMGGITMREYFLDFKKSLEGQLRARDRIKEIYGLDVPVGLPGFSYHHISALGCEIVFPPNSDPAVKAPIFQSLEETEDFPEPDFLSSGTCPHFVRMCEYFASRLPETVIRPVLGAEGPITTAALLRGQDFFAEVMLYPDRVKDYMRRVSDSIAAFHRAVADLCCHPTGMKSWRCRQPWPTTRCSGQNAACCIASCCAKTTCASCRRWASRFSTPA